jgi:hypothetical protein
MAASSVTHGSVVVVMEEQSSHVVVGWQSPEAVKKLDEIATVS